MVKYSEEDEEKTLEHVFSPELACIMASACGERNEWVAAEAWLEYADEQWRTR